MKGLGWLQGTRSDSWWLREEGSLIALTNYYDVNQDHGDKMFYISAGAAYPAQQEKVTVGPFSTCEEAQAVAEMMHRMGVWQ
jgi:hypothetical protein